MCFLIKYCSICIQHCAIVYVVSNSHFAALAKYARSLASRAQRQIWVREWARTPVELSQHQGNSVAQGLENICDFSMPERRDTISPVYLLGLGWIARQPDELGFAWFIASFLPTLKPATNRIFEQLSQQSTGLITRSWPFLSICFLQSLNSDNLWTRWSLRLH